MPSPRTGADGAMAPRGMSSPAIPNAAGTVGSAMLVLALAPEDRAEHAHRRGTSGLGNGAAFMGGCSPARGTWRARSTGAEPAAWHAGRLR